MKRKLKDCNPSILLPDTLMTGDGIYVDREIYRVNCLKSCKMKATCGIIIHQLEKNKYEEALETLKNGKLGKRKKNGK